MMRRGAWLVALAALASAGQLRGQQVRGQVKDRDTDAPVSLGIIMLLSGDGDIVARTAVGPQGQYAFHVPRAGRYLLQFVGPGYGPLGSGEFSVGAAETRVFGLQVRRLPAVALDTLTVAGQHVPRRLSAFYERRAFGTGEFLTRQEVQQSAPTVLTDVLRRTTGVTVVSNDLGTRLAGQDPASCPPAVVGRAGPLVFVDGVFLGDGTAVDVDGLMSVHIIEAVEVYGGARLPPPEFDREGSECGVVALWTRADAVPVAPVEIQHPVEVGTQIGGWIGGGGVQEGRMGLRLVIGTVPGIEISPSVSYIAPGAAIGSPGTDRSGSQLVLAVRVHPLSDESSWYVGGGLTFLSLSNSRLNTDDEDHLVVLTGYAWRLGPARPFVELHVMRPVKPADAQVHAYTGVAIRIY